VIKSDGSNLIQLTNLGVNSAPSFSPGGKKIAFVSTIFDIRVMNADGSNLTRLNSNPAFDTLPSWAVADTDGDGASDDQDDFPFDPDETVDNDGDGTGDDDAEDDGQLDTDELACGSDPLDAAGESPDNDADNVPDCADQDDDNSGVATLRTTAR
jgi:hypothetical protein